MTGPENAAYDAAWALIDSSHNILLTSHVNPDGDAIGSLLAVGHAAESAGKRITMALQDAVPASCAFLPGADRIVTPPVDVPCDLVIVVDCEGPFRAGVLEGKIEACTRTLVIDHHPSEREFGTVEIRNTRAAASGEILFGLFRHRGVPITPTIAVCLMAAIMLDTGGFRHSNTSPVTMRTAAELLEAGADIAAIHRELFENRTLAAARLMGIAVANIQRTMSGEIVYTALTRADFERTGASDNETDGINNQLIGIEGAVASALFREATQGAIRVSLRSRDVIDCNAVARVFGGGGHTRAAGCTLHDPLPDAVRQVVAEMEKQQAGARPRD